MEAKYKTIYIKKELVIMTKAIIKSFTLLITVVLATTTKQTNLPAT